MKFESQRANRRKPAFVATLSSFVNSNDADKNRLHIYLWAGNGKKKTGKGGRGKGGKSGKG